MVTLIKKNIGKSIFPEISYGFYKNSPEPITLEGIEEFEYAFEIKLPKAYKDFLLKYNGGNAEPSTFRLISEPKPEVRTFPPFPYSHKVETEYNYVRLLEFYNLSTLIEKMNPELYPEHLIEIGLVDEFKPLLISVGGDDYGVLYHWQFGYAETIEETDFIDIYFLANDFEEFINNFRYHTDFKFTLYCDYGEYEEAKKLIYSGEVGPNDIEPEIGISVLNSVINKYQWFGGLEFIKYLVEKGADTGSLLVRAAGRDIEFVRYCFFDLGMDINQRDNTGSTALMASQNSTEIFLFLLEHGADVYAQNKYGKTALMGFVRNEYADIEDVKILLDRMDNIEQRDNEGRTALYHAIHTYRPELVRLLLEKGADPDIKDNYGHGYTHWFNAMGINSKKNQQEEILSLLEEYGQ